MCPNSPEVDLAGPSLGCVDSDGGDGSLHHNVRVYETLVAHGVGANARIVRKWSEHRSKSTTYFVSYFFRANGHQLSSVKSIDAALYGRLAEGRETPVVYLPSDPSINRPVGQAPPANPWMALLFPLITGGFLMLTVWPMRRQWLLLSTGQATAGTVTATRRVKGGLSTTYQFNDQTGEERAGKTTVPRKEAPEIGAVVTILFDPENPRRNVLYPAPLVCLQT
jgi:hypothetical protein